MKVPIWQYYTLLASTCDCSGLGGPACRADPNDDRPEARSQILRTFIDTASEAATSQRLMRSSPNTTRCTASGRAEDLKVAEPTGGLDE